MLVAVWIITFCLIIGIGIYAGTKIKSANQWSGGDKQWAHYHWGVYLQHGRSEAWQL